MNMKQLSIHPSLKMMQKIYSACFLLMFTISFSAQAQNQLVKIWSNLAPGSENKENNEQWTESKSVTNVYQPNLTPFLLQNQSGPSPAVIIFPGGGYHQIVMEKEGYKVARWLNENGISAFVLKYRLDMNEALRDAQRAVSLIRHDAKKYGIDPGKLGVIGFSAGAHLAGNLVENNQVFEIFDAIDSVSFRPDFWIGVYGVYGDVVIDSSRKTMVFKELEAHANIPPTFLVHAGDDSKSPVQNSVKLYSVLKEKGVSAELHVYEFGEHGFALETNRGSAITSTVNDWSGRCLEWLKIKGFLEKNKTNN